MAAQKHLTSFMTVAAPTPANSMALKRPWRSGSQKPVAVASSSTSPLASVGTESWSIMKLLKLKKDQADSGIVVAVSESATDIASKKPKVIATDAAVAPPPSNAETEGEPMVVEEVGTTALNDVEDAGVVTAPTLLDEEESEEDAAQQHADEAGPVEAHGAAEVA